MLTYDETLDEVLEGASVSAASAFTVTVEDVGGTVGAVAVS